MLLTRCARRAGVARRCLSTAPAVSSDGTALAWSATDGDAAKPPVLLIGGWASAAADWRGVAPLLGRRVVTYDARGTGASGALGDAPLTMALMAEDALAVARAAGGAAAAPLDVLGHSMGGLVAQELAAVAPSEVRRLVLASTSPGGEGLGGLISRDYFDVLDGWADDDGTKVAEAARRRAAAEYWVHGLPRAHVEANVEGLKGLVDEMVDGAVAPRRAATIAAQKRAICSPFPSAERFRTLPEKPTLVLHGDVDAVLDPFCGTRLAKEIPKAKLLLLAGVGHHAFTQEPAEWAKLVAEFLDADLDAKFQS